MYLVHKNKSEFCLEIFLIRNDYFSFPDGNVSLSSLHISVVCRHVWLIVDNRYSVLMVLYSAVKLGKTLVV